MAFVLSRNLHRQLNPLLLRGGGSGGRTSVAVMSRCCRSYHASSPRRDTKAGGTVGGSDAHRLFEEQLRELQEEREALFGFTEDDHAAWSNAGGHRHRHEASFLDEIEAARFSSSSSPADAEECSPEFPNDTVNPADEGAINSHSPTSFSSFSHVSSDGSSVHMVDVGSKIATRRVAVAQSRVVFPPEVVEAFRRSCSGSSSSSTTTTAAADDELVGPKGPIFATAKIAGIMAAKRTSELIPLCHPLPLDAVNLDIRLHGDSVVVVHCECRTFHKTGVEMEALTGATIAALTIYDMVKAVSHKVRIEDTVLLSKSGGKRTV